MGLILNTKGVEVHNSIFVQKEGRYLLKLEKWELDGFTIAGDQQFKIFFKGVEEGTQEPIYSHSERFSVGEKSLWRVKQLELALKSPEVYDIDDWMNRYVIVDIVAESYIKDGLEKKAYKIKKWYYSKTNDKMPPISEAKQDTGNDGGVYGSEVQIDINEDKIPF